MIAVGPCSVWTSAAEVTGQCAAADAAVIPSLLTVDLAIEAASEYLFERSARQFPGLCTAVIRPLRPSGYSGPGPGRRRLEEVDLSVYPVVSVPEVLIDGAVFSPSGYEVQGRRLLVRRALPPDYDNPGWPTEQRMDRAPTEPGTWQVTVQYGIEPPALGVMAVNALAWEFAKACTGQVCKVPIRTQSLVRQGVTVKVVDPNSLPPGRLGIPEVDNFLAAYNPANVQRKPQVWSPDLARRARRVTWTP